MIQLTQAQLNRMLAIEQIVNRPTGIVTFMTWYQPSVKLPDLSPNSSFDSLPVLLAIDGDYTVGFFSYPTERWFTDIGTLERDQVIYWAVIPDPTA